MFCPYCAAPVDGLKFCGECGKQILAPVEQKDLPWSAAVQESQKPETAREKEKQQEVKVALYGCLGLFVLMGGCFVWLTNAPREPVSVDSTRVDSGDITDERFRVVAEVFATQGVRSERDPSARNTVRFRFPASALLGMTKMQAQVVASEARGRLGGNAIVYIQTESGDTIAKASPWGLE